MAPPRPLAGLPAADPRAVARAWLVRRIAAAPLEAAPALAVADLVARGPSLCGSLLAALADDAALAALPAAAPVLAALVASPAGGSAHGRAAFGDDAPDRSVILGAGSHHVFAETATAASGLAAASEHLRGAVLDVLAPSTDPALHAPLHDRLAHACAVLLGAALSAPEPIVAHDTRAPLDPRGRLTAEAERLVVAAVPFALLAVEVEDAAVVPAGVLAAAEGALRAALPTGALHAPDGPGSLLVLARETDGVGLARSLTGAVAGAASHHGAPLRAAAGVAEHPRDGDTPERLLAHADGQLFAARAEGLPLA